MANFDVAILGSPANATSLLNVDNTAGTGIYKLVQRILILMFKDKDDPNSLGIGTNLPTELFGANIQDREILKNTLNIAMDRVKETLVSSTPADAPDDEKIDNIQVELLTPEGRDTEDIQLTVTSLAGSQFTVVVPISDTALLSADVETLPVLGE